MQYSMTFLGHRCQDYDGLSTPVTGDVKPNPAGGLDIFDGREWMSLDYAAIAQPVAFIQKTEKQIEDELCEQHPGLKELRDQFETLKALVAKPKE
jgi:hypothetical protein